MSISLLQFPHDPKSVLLYSLAFLVAAFACLIFVAVFCGMLWFLQKLIAGSVVSPALGHVQTFVQELKGTRAKLGLINGYSVVFLSIALLTALIFEAAPSVLKQLFGGDFSERPFPIITVMVLVGCVIVYLWSMTLIALQEKRKHAQQKAAAAKKLS